MDYLSRAVALERSDPGGVGRSPHEIRLRPSGLRRCLPGTGRAHSTPERSLLLRHSSPARSASFAGRAGRYALSITAIRIPGHGIRAGGRVSESIGLPCRERSDRLRARPRHGRPTLERSDPGGVGRSPHEIRLRPSGIRRCLPVVGRVHSTPELEDHVEASACRCRVVGGSGTPVGRCGWVQSARRRERRALHGRIPSQDPLGSCHWWRQQPAIRDARAGVHEGRCRSDTRSNRTKNHLSTLFVDNSVPGSLDAVKKSSVTRPAVRLLRN
jgi:hypothetical protein